MTEGGNGSTTDGRLEGLYSECGQSPWLDNLRRGWITGGELEAWVERGIRGLTSNPSIFQKAIESSDDYDEQFGDLVCGGTSVDDAYWQLVTSDIRGALRALEPVHAASGGTDGFVSVEVDPSLAHNTEATTKAARELHQGIAWPNLMVKIPGTVEGLPAIRQMIAEGYSINVTLIFSVARYEQVADAYVAGLEDRVAAGITDLSGVASVASFFVSRTDTEVDRLLDAVGTPSALGLRGRTAVAQAQAAYGRFGEIFSGPRWERLAALGAQVQRPLWASTSTKNPAYPDTLYVDELIGPNTVNTMPDATLDAFCDHGKLRRTIDADQSAARYVLEAVTSHGVDLDGVADTLEAQGVAAFTKSFDELLVSLEAKADSLA
ncbi:transaldolase [Candidatus Poriferisodalis sp.]|uniref:transaldolase n=1 Tax=Candidatus Poriferisodalis sp. TaxID=3101277 RepID=UPI003B5AA820